MPFRTRRVRTACLYAAKLRRCGMHSFDDFGLDAALRTGLAALNYTQPTPIQSAALPFALAGRDLIAQAPTGSGKTVAFGLALLARIDPALIRAQALVLCPTRELAEQVSRELRKLALGIPNLKLSTLCGGTALAPQLASLQAHDPQIVVGTPGRVQELMRKKVLHLGGVKTLVLDEADRMLDMGFEPAIREISARTAGDRQSLLFSATFPEPIVALAQSLLRSPERVEVEHQAQPLAITQHFVETAHSQRSEGLLGLLAHFKPASCVVFCNTRRDTDEIAGALIQRGYSALALHGDMEQRDREEVLLRFANRSARVLVASDVAARGLDIDDLAAVINLELPHDIEVYTHRIGRTGRAGKTGLAISLVTPAEMPRALALEDALGSPLHWLRDLPAAGRATAPPPPPAMITLRIDAGKTDKLRPGDIVGALTGDAALTAESIGKIDIFPTRSFVAIQRKLADLALQRLRAGKIKGRRFRVRRVD